MCPWMDKQADRRRRSTLKLKQISQSKNYQEQERHLLLHFLFEINQKKDESVRHNIEHKQNRLTEVQYEQKHIVDGRHSLGRSVSPNLHEGMFKGTEVSTDDLMSLSNYYRQYWNVPD
ncbi:hypothetical protein Anapl_04162 [Anas platyrhynchos]|uniref:Uncharacterized protein n=1 Tax=Anas platyrhynchos TaxID=8839 RepID=R0LCU7_ANAPL|nr:hypothetical protein Anapl_04162 [Anas platyrhynchos]